MGTNQYNNWQNKDGSTRFYYSNTNGAPLYDYSGCEPAKRDGCHGIRLFVESRGYNVFHDGSNYQNYNQYIYGYQGNTQGFTFDQFKAEIDAGRTVLIHTKTETSGHSMLGYGYDDPSTIYIHDTWNHADHSMTWGGTYSGMKHYGVTVIQLKSQAVIIYVPDDYAKIQWAVNNASDGDTIIVRDGTYTENVDVGKRLTIQSQNGSANCIVNVSNSNDHVFEVTANYVNISGFNATGATGTGGIGKAGIYLHYVSHCNISGNTATNNYDGIFLYGSTNNNNTLTGNTANQNNRYGIHLHHGGNHNVSCNWVAHNVQAGFNIAGTSIGNNISYNNIMHNGNYNPATGGYEWNLRNFQADAVTVEHNYWAATTNETIALSIWEWGEVTFYPFETIPPPCAPIPELATIILFSVGLVVLAGYVVLRRRK